MIAGAGCFPPATSPRRAAISIAMAHERKSEQNRFIQEGVDPEIPYGLPSDDLHPDGEPHAKSKSPGAPDEAVNPDASVDWGTLPGEGGEGGGEQGMVPSQKHRTKPDEAA